MGRAGNGLQKLHQEKDPAADAELGVDCPPGGFVSTSSTLLAATLATLMVVPTVAKQRKLPLQQHSAQ